ncbi:hypothetical protein DFH09DRAFT_1282687 [Mycena vulgaris]|nr:hypothetical protein DFH09DRAFT_1282687 [Mycena vulgaris]
MTNPVDKSPVEPGPIAFPSDTSESQPNIDGTHRRKFRRRAIYAFAGCFTLALLAFSEHPPSVGRPVEELAHGAVNIAEDIRLEVIIQAYQTPDNAEYCAEWTPVVDQVSETERHLASTSFELPTAADLLFFLSRGPVSGHIDFVKNSKYSSGPIQVNITAQYYDAKDLESTKACRMGPANDNGVLIWAEPRHPHGNPKRDVRFNITVALPSATTVRSYKDLTTDMALFSHTVGEFFDLWSPTSFEVIRLKTSNAAIDHGSFIALSALIQTSNAKVEGFFGGFELSVQTSNAPIVSTALMFGESPGSESRVHLRTSNGAITSLMGLVSDYKDNVLRAVVRTSGASLTVDTIRQPKGVNSSFFLDAATSVGPATVSLYPKYEGTYDLRTSGARAEIDEDQNVSDPAGEGRNRTVTKTITGQHARGSIYWSHDGEPTEGVQRGSIKLTTSVSSIKLAC